MSQRLRKAKAKRGRPATGAALSAAERMRRMRERRKAAGFKPKVSWVPRTISASPPYSSHRLLEARSLAMHALIAAKIERNPDLLAKARANLNRWKGCSDEQPDWMREWSDILQRPWRDIAARITEPSENAARLRQSSPFAGVLTPRERERMYEAFRP